MLQSTAARTAVMGPATHPAPLQFHRDYNQAAALRDCNWRPLQVRLRYNGRLVCCNGSCRACSSSLPAAQLPDDVIVYAAAVM